MMHCPKFSLEVASNFIALVIASFLADIGLNSVLDNVPEVTPSAGTLKNVMIDEGVDTIYLEKTAMKGSCITLLADKGEGSKKRGGAAFVKLVARWDAVKKRIRVLCLGIQGAGNSSMDAADAIDHALKFYDFDDKRVLLSNHGTDAGGGGTRRDLFLKLSNVNRVMNLLEYIYTTCALHGLNLCLSSPTTLTMGDGGLLKRNALQCLHTAYNLAQQYTSDEWAAIWKLVTGITSVNVKCPVMTRWECVGECVEHVTKYREQWNLIAKNIVATEKSNNRHTIASYLSSYLSEHIIIAHIYFLRGYYRSWWNPHFQWQKHVDSRTKAPGFLGCHMAVHFFVQDRDLKAIKNNWKTNEHFAAFVSEFELADSEYAIDDIADKYFARADAIHTKHFFQWRNDYLHIALAGDDVPARYIAN